LLKSIEAWQQAVFFNTGISDGSAEFTMKSLLRPWFNVVFDYAAFGYCFVDEHNQLQEAAKGFGFFAVQPLDCTLPGGILTELYPDQEGQATNRNGANVIFILVHNSLS
jgi:hypothetical protein